MLCKLCILYCHPVRGITVVGPFETYADASEYLATKPYRTHCWVVPLYPLQPEKAKG